MLAIGINAIINAKSDDKTSVRIASLSILNKSDFRYKVCASTVIDKIAPQKPILRSTLSLATGRFK